MRLINWDIHKSGDSFRMVGEIYGDNDGRFKDGERIVTSPLSFIDFRENFVQTKRNRYELGNFYRDGTFQATNKWEIDQ